MRVGLSAAKPPSRSGDYFGDAGGRGEPALRGRGYRADPGRRRRARTAGPHEAFTGWSRSASSSLKGLPTRCSAWEVPWDPDEDSRAARRPRRRLGLLRGGSPGCSRSEGIDVVLQASDAEPLLAGLAGARPHVVVVDVRMPPTHTTEGLEAAERIQADHPEVGVLVLSAKIQAGRRPASARGGPGASATCSRSASATSPSWSRRSARSPAAARRSIPRSSPASAELSRAGTPAPRARGDGRRRSGPGRACGRSSAHGFRRCAG